MTLSTPNSEKHELEHGEDYGHHHHSKDIEATYDHSNYDHTRDVDHGYDPVMLKKLMRKVDRRLIPILSGMCLERPS